MQRKCCSTKLLNWLFFHVIVGTPPRYVLVNASDWAVFLAPTITSYLSRGDGLALFHWSNHQPAIFSRMRFCQQLPTSPSASFFLFYDASKPVTRARRPCSGTSRNKLRAAFVNTSNKSSHPTVNIPAPRSNPPAWLSLIHRIPIPLQHPIQWPPVSSCWLCSIIPLSHCDYTVACICPMEVGTGPCQSHAGPAPPQPTHSARPEQLYIRRNRRTQHLFPNPQLDGRQMSTRSPYETPRSFLGLWRILLGEANFRLLGIWACFSPERPRSVRPDCQDLALVNKLGTVQLIGPDKDWSSKVDAIEWPNRCKRAGQEKPSA